MTFFLVFFWTPFFTFPLCQEMALGSFSWSSCLIAAICLAMLEFKPLRCGNLVVFFFLFFFLTALAGPL